MSKQNVNDGTAIREGIPDGMAAAAAYLMGFDVRVSHTYTEKSPYDPGDPAGSGEMTYTVFGDSRTWKLHLPDGQAVPFPLTSFLEAWGDTDTATQALDAALDALPAEFRAALDSVLPAALVAWLREYYTALVAWDDAEKSCPRQFMVQDGAETILLSEETALAEESKLKTRWNL
jgi:hypothetical protein